jgi:DNA-binding GntR family transcriptional regulator
MAPSLSERAYVELRDRVLTLQLPPGTPINESKLSEELGVGRTPLREAIKRLARESLVEVYPRRGTFVSDIQLTDLGAISEVRIELEGLAAGLAARRFREEQDGREIGALLRRLESVGKLSTDKLAGVDADIHRFIYRTARNDYLEDSLTRYFALSHRIWNLALTRMRDGGSQTSAANVESHAELLRAIRAHDAERARQLATDHVLAFQEEMRALL